jgi:hypothetical protein
MTSGQFKNMCRAQCVKLNINAPTEIELDRLYDGYFSSIKLLKTTGSLIFENDDGRLMVIFDPVAKNPSRDGSI